MACPHCGSCSVKADRSLAGRMVCGRCGRPLQGAAAAGSRARPPRRRGAGGLGSGVRPGLRWLLVLLVVSAGLAWLAGTAPPQPTANDPLERLQPWRR